ncbi:TetR family transcriptional regulator [Rhizobium sp. PP-F2F-G38]|uniref:TetR family transcriptional regulator C-terminal domain-containing protein n=1 Tax=Rhizobium sp. PP-CC-3G-465 TaxID=2135648 RepID=UPI000D90CADE|nr:TetR family transcriptional regulator [Rhizobium sp. PP-WC-1G-195]PYE94969.1 TetR family transcriptional regulator [Rhizobium sp. PP-F2F-G38]TCP82160.1 TetR family transcriptional regulator [Rhizobium sp. PP-CC-2G-626]TCQ03167.1 TetR family transcriptional regulator [Rhizobium sp. PP-F2F-G36]TCQ25853.1 TetR family transcriptional regulator [Rhizobium sp. PP-CC-3G-465]
MENVKSKRSARGKAAATGSGQEEKIRERNERQILEAATVLFSRKGFQGTRTSEIAEAAGLPKANVYYYFSSKEQIYSAVIRHLIAGWDDALQQIRADREPAEALEAYVRAKLDYAWHNKEESRMFATEILAGAPFLSRRDREHMRDVTKERSEIIEHWIRQGKLKPVDPRHLFIILWSSTQFYADFDKLACDALETTRLTAADLETAAQTIVQTVIGSLLK